MIPARMGSKRLPKKNLEEIGGRTLIHWAVERCIDSGAFDEIWVNSEDLAFREVATNLSVNFHLRPFELGSDKATSEQFVSEFLERHECDFVIQVHSVTPLLDSGEIREFVKQVRADDADTILSGVEGDLEHVLETNPVNFSFDAKSNSQDLTPVFQITWPITAWRRETFLNNEEPERCSTYCGRIKYFPVSRFSGLAIKVEQDLKYAQALFPHVFPEKLELRT